MCARLIEPRNVLLFGLGRMIEYRPSQHDAILYIVLMFDSDELYVLLGFIRSSFRDKRLYTALSGCNKRRSSKIKYTIIKWSFVRWKTSFSRTLRMVSPALSMMMLISSENLPEILLTNFYWISLLCVMCIIINQDNNLAPINCVSHTQPMRGYKGNCLCVFF